MASGHGKTSGRGMKGQRARENIRPGFEGGQTPLFRRMRKRRGISQSAMPVGPFRKAWAVVNIGRLEAFDAGATVTPDVLLEKRIVRNLKDGLRVLGDGELSKSLHVHAHHFSASAAKKIEAAGGTANAIASGPGAR